MFQDTRDGEWKEESTHRLRFVLFLSFFSDPTWPWKNAYSKARPRHRVKRWLKINSSKRRAWCSKPPAQWVLHFPSLLEHRWKPYDRRGTGFPGNVKYNLLLGQAVNRVYATIIVKTSYLHRYRCITGERGGGTVLHALRYRYVFDISRSKKKILF